MNGDELDPADPCASALIMARVLGENAQKLTDAAQTVDPEGMRAKLAEIMMDVAGLATFGFPSRAAAMNTVGLAWDRTHGI